MTGVLTFLGEWAVVISNDRKAAAETLLRKLDLQESFGWEIARVEIADAWVALTKKQQSNIETSIGGSEYFETAVDAGWLRAMNNLFESAWWSKHLSRAMATFAFFLTISLIVLSAILLISSSLLVPEVGTLTTVNRIVISLLLLVVSLGLIPLARNYRSFGLKSAGCELTAQRLLAMEGDQTIPAIKAWNEYHLARASAPLIPSLLWKWKRDSLNKAWKELIAEQMTEN